MVNLEDLANRLLGGKRITLYYKKYNDGTEAEPDIYIHRVFVDINSNNDCSKDMVVYLSKEDDKYIFETDEVYRMPFITDLNVLKYVLKEIRKQSHFPFDK